MTSATENPARLETQSHFFLGAGHERNERRTWIVIWLCAFVMLVEIAGGICFGSIALVADGLHMSTHAGALLLAALAYRFARRHVHDPRFSFGTGKLGDLAGFASAIILAMISLLIAYAAIRRFIAPVPIRFTEAIPIAGFGLIVNIVTAWLLGGGHDHSHSHSHSHSHGHAHGHSHAAAEGQQIETPHGRLRLEIFEAGVPARFRLHAELGPLPDTARIKISRPGGDDEVFAMVRTGDYFESVDSIAEPHEFAAILHLPEDDYALHFAEPAHAGGKTGRDNNMRAAFVHVLADAAVTVLVIAGLLLAKIFGWLWMDPLVGIVGAIVIASWASGLIRDTGAILLDMTPDREMAETMRRSIEAEGDMLADFHLWRLGPGHLGAILCIGTRRGHDAAYYRGRLRNFPGLSHITVEVRQV